MTHIDPLLRLEVRLTGHCWHCGRHDPVDCHHIYGKGMGGAWQLDIPENLIALCRQCHDDFHFGHILRDDLLAIVAARLGKLQDKCKATIVKLKWRTE